MWNNLKNGELWRLILVYEYYILFFLVVFWCNYVIICIDKLSLMDMVLCILEFFKINGIIN